MICFFLFVHYINGDIVRKIFILFFSFLFYFFGVKCSVLSDDSYNIHTLYFYNLSTNNVLDFFSDINIVRIYPSINPIYKDRLGNYFYEVRGFDLKSEIKNFSEVYLNMIKKNSYLDYNYLFVNGINISKMDIYVSNRDFYNIINDDRLLVNVVK